jgi:hypothetical protein
MSGLLSWVKQWISDGAPAKAYEPHPRRVFRDHTERHVQETSV